MPGLVKGALATMNGLPPTWYMDIPVSCDFFDITVYLTATKDQSRCCEIYHVLKPFLQHYYFCNHYFVLVLQYIILSCIILYHIIMYCIILYRIVLYNVSYYKSKSSGYHCSLLISI